MESSTYKQNAIKIKDELWNYFQKTPYDQYVNMVSLVTLSSIENAKKIKLKENESLDDLCLQTFISNKPPAELDFPSEYKGLKVFYKGNEDIYFHKKK